MRHADDALFDSRAAAVADQVVEQRDQSIAALEREALLADVLGVQVALEAFGRRQLPEDVLFLPGAEPAEHAPRLEFVLQPQALFGIRYVRELRTDRAAVDVAQLRDDFAQRQARGDRPAAAAREEFGVEVGIRQAEVAELEYARQRPLHEPERIERRDQVAAVRPDLHEARHRALLRALEARAFDGRRGEGRLARTLRDRGDDRRVRLLAVPPGAELREPVAPVRLDARGITQVLVVQGLDVRGIAAIQRGGSELVRQALVHSAKMAAKRADQFSRSTPDGRAATARSRPAPHTPPRPRRAARRPGRRRMRGCARGS
ncbi:MAG: hypothetical protein CMLOHMNK_02230 [Steroidobacteraceae bacterium]|nr:hypothetical protein [Steroidobacteraceae bacterium]